MPGNRLFEYAIVRIVPKVEREEFLNVGVILYCKEQDFLQMRFTLDTERICSFCGTVDVDELKTYLQAMENICKGAREGGEIGGLDTASRFRWLTAARSTVVQTSKVHPGLCGDANEALDKLYNQLVL
jgi:hypothetical protein